MCPLKEIVLYTKLLYSKVESSEGKTFSFSERVFHKPSDDSSSFPSLHMKLLFFTLSSLFMMRSSSQSSTVDEDGSSAKKNLSSFYKFSAS